LLIASVDKAREMGINWWESDPFVSTGELGKDDQDGSPKELQERVEVLESRLKDLDDSKQTRG
jgi:hypothetical protein